MLRNKKICFRLTTRRIIGLILTIASMINLLIVGAVFVSAPASPGPTPSSTPPIATRFEDISSSTPIAEVTATLSPSDTPTQTPSSTPTYTFTPTGTDTQTPSITPTYTITSTASITLSPSPTPCVPQYSWKIYLVQSGDMLSKLAVATGSSVEEIMLANCLPSDKIYPGQVLYVPRLPIPTFTPTQTQTTLTCAEFEDLKAGTAYKVGETFASSGIHINVGAFVWGNGTPTSGGFASVSDGQAADGFGMEIGVNNVNLIVDVGNPLSSLSLLFGEYGGNLNINVNGDFRNFENFSDINRMVIGGANVSVLNGFGNDTGYLQLSGRIESFAIGGQELWIDNMCTKT